MPERTLTQDEVKHIAKGLLLDFKKLAGFDQAAISEIHPMHDPSGKLQYYEVKFSSPANHDNGYAVISATTADMPVVEFSEQGPTHFERLRNKIGHDTFRMVRFSPSFVAAEDNAGKPLAEIGRRPVIIPAELQTAMRAEAKAKAGEPPVTTGVLATPELVRLRKGQLSTSIPYATFKQRFVQPRPKTARLDPAWALALEPHHNPGCTLNYFWADGLHNHPFYLQIPKNTPPNNNDHASGCGPAAWLNLFGWHDFNWRPELLSAQHMYNDPYINNLTMACHDHIGTYEPWFTFGADQGFTWPGDMPKGYDFARVHLHHDCGYWWRQDWWNTDEPWVFEVARDVIRNRRPFIVGYYQDWHYAVGYGVAECATHGWQHHSWLRIYPAWSTDGRDDKWIPLETIFAVYGVYDFFPLLEFTGLDAARELEVAVNGPGDANRMFVYTGTATFNSHGAVGADWLRDTISFDIGGTFGATSLRRAVATVGLASIANKDKAVNAGWAIDRVSATRNPANGKIRLTLNYGIRDIDGYLLRAGYKVSVLAKV